MTEENNEFAGTFDSHQTFISDEYGEKITQHRLAKMFEQKFQALKYKVVKVIDGRNKQVTIYRFKSDVVNILTNKYGLEKGQKGLKGTLDAFDALDPSKTQVNSEMIQGDSKQE